MYVCLNTNMYLGLHWFTCCKIIFTKHIYKKQHDKASYK